MKVTYNLKSGFIYILTDSDRYSKNKFKVGFTSKNKCYLVNRYITRIPKLQIHMFLGTYDIIEPKIPIPFVGELEKDIMRNFDTNRLIE